MLVLLTGADLTERLDGGASDRVRAFPIDEGKKTGEFARTGGAAGFLESRDPFADEPCPSAVQPRGAASTLRKVVMRSLVFAAGGCPNRGDRANRGTGAHSLPRQADALL